METIDYLKELAISRTKVARLKAEVKDLEKELEESELGARLSNARDSLKLLEVAQKGLINGIKIRVEEEFISSGLENTNPYDGVQVKKFQEVHILDEDAAKEWAAINVPNVVTLNKSNFDKVAKAVGGLKFVQIVDDYRAQIASDLSMYEKLDE